MPYLNFSDALMEAKRRAQLQGRPISQQEVAGVAQGFATTAAEKNIQEQSLGLQEKGLEAQKSQFAESLAQRKYETERQIEAAKEAKELETKSAVGTTIGAVGGGVAGYYIGGAIGSVGGPLGTIVGAGIGGMLGGAVGKMCIIISACTSPDSYEVKIAREYRDKFMDEEILTGYYSLCIPIVPIIRRFPFFRSMVKKVLVDRLVDYGEWKLEYKSERKYLTSSVVKTLFLGLCRLLGKGVNGFLEVRNA